MNVSTSDLCDQFGDALRVLPPLFRDFGGRCQFSGKVVTVHCFEDNSRVRELVHTAGGGNVLVVDGGGSLRCALLGDQLAAAAVNNKWEGIVIYGCVRDRAVLATLPMGIMALEATPRRSQKRGEVRCNSRSKSPACRVGPVITLSLMPMVSF